MTRNWHPPTEGSRGEVALAKALQNAGIRYEFQVPICTVRRWYICDFMLDNAIVVEVNGGLHRRTWRGKTALTRMRKDDEKTSDLTKEGYTVLRFPDTDILKRPNEVIAKILQTLR